MELTREEARDAIFGDYGWETIESEIVDTSRWSIIKETISKHEKSGKYYRFNYSTGSTECQEERPFEYDEEPIIPTEVHQVEVMGKQWVKVEK